MKIHGLQKMTLLDFPGHVACTVFLSGCDLRCPFCHNYQLAEGKEAPLMEDAQLLAFLSKRKGLLDGVAFTGGEPLLHKELPGLMEEIRRMGFKIKLDTNGCHPDALRNILEKGLADYVAMDIKNSPEKYAVTCGREQMDLAPVLKSIALLRAEGEMGNGFDYEFRTTVVEEFFEASDFERIGEMIRGAKHYYLQAFTDRDTVPFGNLHAPSEEKMRKYAEIARFFVPETQLRGID